MLENNYYSQTFFTNDYYFLVNELLFYKASKKVMIYFLVLLTHHLSNMKYQTELANGSTIASVKAIVKDTSATSIKTVIAIAKWPIV